MNLMLFSVHTSVLGAASIAMGIAMHDCRHNGAMRVASLCFAALRMGCLKRAAPVITSCGPRLEDVACTQHTRASWGSVAESSHTLGVQGTLL
jgi:hypothetical protein